jgi:ABC-2 type transport system permease protein
VTIEPLLLTSASAYGKTDLKNLNTGKSASDIGGPLVLAMAITDKSADGNTANDGRTVVIGTSKIMDSSVIAASNKGNVNFIMNSINWVVGNRDNISILPKDMQADNLTINQMQALIASAFAVVVIPLIVVVTGVVVWVRRRHL